MKISLDYIDTNFDFEGDWGVESKCGLKIIEGKEKTIVIVAELPDNPGTQITSVSGDLARQICEAHQIQPERLIYIEHTPDMNSKLSFYDETFFRVDFELTDGNFTSPKWEKINRQQVDELIDSIK